MHIIINLLEEEESGEALDAESLSDCLLLCSIDLTEEVGWLVLAEFLSCLSILGCQCFAVTAKLGEHVLRNC